MGNRQALLRRATAAIGVAVVARAVAMARASPELDSESLALLFSEAGCDGHKAGADTCAHGFNSVLKLAEMHVPMTSGVACITAPQLHPTPRAQWQETWTSADTRR